jgi:hypothetical protein
LRFNLGFISWFASISKIHFQSSIFPSFCGFEFKVFFKFFLKFLQIYYNLIVSWSYFSIPFSHHNPFPTFHFPKFFVALMVSFFFRTFANLLSFRI